MFSYLCDPCDGCPHCERGSFAKPHVPWTGGREAWNFSISIPATFLDDPVGDKRLEVARQLARQMRRDLSDV